MAVDTTNQIDKMQQLAVIMSAKNFDASALIQTEFFPDCLQNLNTQQCKSVCEALAEPNYSSFVNKKGPLGGYTPLHWMCIKNEYDLIEMLLVKCKADINSCANLGESPLFICIKNCNLYTIELLIQHGADLYHRDIYNRSLIHWCAYTGKVILMYYFEKYHSINNLNDVDQFQQSALHIACASGFSDLIMYLIDRGDIDFFLKDFNGNNCLHMAAKCGLSRICWILTKQNKGQCAKLIGDMNNQSQTPFDIIRNEKGSQYKKIRDWLRLEAKTNKYLLYNENNYDKKSDTLYSGSSSSLLKIKKGTFWLNWNDDFKMRLDWYTRLFVVLILFVIPMLINRYLIYPGELSLIKGIVGFTTYIGLFYVMVGQRHRCTHISAYQNPFYVGLIVNLFISNYSSYYLIILDYNQFFTLLEMTKVGLALYHNLFFYWVLTSDPGKCKESHKKPDGTSYELRDLLKLNAKDSKGGKDSIDWLTDPPSFGGTDKPIQLPQLFFCEPCLKVQAVPTKHCKLCECCVSKFDHHCLFIGKCVGLKNHRLFMLFLLSALISCTVFIYTVYTYFYSFNEGLIASNKDKKDEDKIDFIYVLFTSTDHVWLVVLLLINAFIIIMVFFLFMFQIKFISLGYTSQIRPPVFFVQTNRRMQTLFGSVIHRLENIFTFLFESCDSNLELYFKQQREYNLSITSEKPIALSYDPYPRDNFDKKSNTQLLLPKENPNKQFEIDLD
ncbi:unnamed protein product [Brachionus calyciflorus]|uniref:Palmitoyltransferase n=1 Tax=Brachionus calyciflorus TaxID=104777 RepID=A0A813XED5_9BILA|nr:unnamed protein product [Brachionus calyciflorus]